MDLKNPNYNNNYNEKKSSRSCPRITLRWEGRLYDVTDFAGRHPGGRHVLERHSGQSVDSLMQDPAFHVHSRAAYAILDKYLVNGGDGAAMGNGSPRLIGSGSSKIQEDRTQTADFDGYVDLSQPLVGQVEELGEHYYDWTHRQVDRPIRLFRSDLAEMFTRAYWWMVPLLWGPLVFAMLASSYSHLASQPETWPRNNALSRQYGPASIPLLLALGVLFWTLLEYIIHRWLFHLKPPASSRLLIRLHFLFHGQHHKSPMDPMRLVFPPVPASMFGVAFYLLTNLIFPTGMAHAVFAGIIAGYVSYDLTHYYVHHGGTPSIDYFRRLKTYHTLHHYKHQNLGFGISSKLWDFPFCTRIPVDSGVKKAH
ncbi:hypothetical protein EGW08_013649 [Elysia chlorotica]|uniref:Fatty acid 2-hydroxylase n=1 Tax=Elysia chlorotica TaxID=188477 RepID=A0A433TAI3_ELYCH|nr:hypothetical protein EGW08_013649 [Elysia chlorotica]